MSVIKPRLGMSLGLVAILTCSDTQVVNNVRIPSFSETLQIEQDRTLNEVCPPRRYSSFPYVFVQPEEYKCI